MRKFCISGLLTMMCAMAFAIPAKRGIYKTIKLADGTEVRVELRGDEHVHFWQASDGRQFLYNVENDSYIVVNADTLRRDYSVVQDTKTVRKSAGQRPSEPIVGERKGLIVLVQFSDKKFQEEHDTEYFNNILNTRGYTSSTGYVGSVRDYFYDQSDGQLDYTFDVLGPVTLANPYAYYGEPSSTAKDKNLKSFVLQSINAIKGQVNFSKYDNDGDKYVDNIFFIYAGNGEADSGDKDAIWPHMYYIQDGFGTTFSQNGVKLNVYACSMEIQGDGKDGGIGAICHEFSHCLGLPDTYDTGSSENYGTSYWDIMDAGCYLGDCFRPAGYNAYEQDFCGWKSIEALSGEQVTINNAKGIGDGGTAYSITNPGNQNEYFILEPRTKKGWDSSLPGEGILIYHVDYDYYAWVSNSVNNVSGHQRLAIVPADNDYSMSIANIGKDAFPNVSNRVFSDITTPSSKLFNKNIDGTYNLGKSVYDMSLNDDGTVSFSYMEGVYVYDNNAPEGSVFYESFGRCDGLGGNDNVFTGTVGLGDFYPDNEGWVATNKFAGLKCAKFGTNRQNGIATSPAFELDGTATLTFKAAPYASECANITVSITGDDATISDNKFSLSLNQWKDCETVISGKGKVSLKFSGTKRWFLDEVLIMPSTSGIETINVDGVLKNFSSFNILGQRVNDSTKGITIRNGKKYFVK